MNIVFVEGVDATGKTSLVKALGKLERMPTIDEFSTTAPGDMIRSIIGKKDFFYLDGPGNHRLAETFILVGDLLAKLETVRQSGCAAAISDRGSLSLRAYQFARIARDHDTTLASRVDTILKMVFELPCIRSVDVVLTANANEMLKRKKERGDQGPSESEIHSMMTAQEFMVGEARDSGIIVDTSDLTTEDVVHRVRALLKEWF